MKSIFATHLTLSLALITIAVLISGCSSSNEPTTIVESESSIVTNDGSGQLVDDPVEGVTQSQTQIDSVNNSDPDTVVNTDESTSEDTSEDSAATVTPTPSVPDPLNQNTTAVEFNITVPAYVSNALQVRVVWDDRNLAAQWVGDELWSLTDNFESDTEHLLSVTFYDGNGETTLASFEQNYRTGSNDLEVYTISADQFDTESWDSDNDGVSNIIEGASGTTSDVPSRVLLFSETRDYRHESIEVALVALEELAASAGIQVDAAGDSGAVFTDENLANYDAVVWVLTSGDVLDSDEQSSFERYIQGGGGYAGIHAASDTEYDWPWYGRLVGAYFERHPVIQTATLNVEDSTHLSTSHLDSTWTRTDEWYDFQSNPRAEVNVLLSLDEGSYSGGGMGADHPSAWYHEFDGGRSWYTGGGHTDASYAEANFRAHLLGGLRYVVGSGL